MNRSGAFVGWSDADLVDAARGTRPNAYGELFERWYDRCYDVALNICRNSENAADVTQDTFLAAWEQLAQLRDPAAFGGGSSGLPGTELSTDWSENALGAMTR